MSDEKGPELFKIADRIKADYEARGVEVPYYWIHKKSGVAYNTVVSLLSTLSLSSFLPLVLILVNV